jgi:peroxidase
MQSLPSLIVVFVTALAMFASQIGGAAQNLSSGFYGASCPSLQSVVRSSMRSAVQKEARMAASILRLFFHDCFVQVVNCVTMALNPKP